jgi:hypothetical protein
LYLGCKRFSQRAMGHCGAPIIRSVICLSVSIVSAVNSASSR